jgi:hypothetical protein
MKEFLLSAVVCCLTKLLIRPVNEASTYFWTKVGKDEKQ